MKIKKCYGFLIFLLLMLSIPVVRAGSMLYASPTVGVFKLESKNITEQTTATISNAIFSFVKELKKYDIVDMRSTPVTETDAQQRFDYVFAGKITGLENGIQLELMLKNSSDKITRRISKIYQSVNLILLDSRVLVSDIFDKSVNLSVTYNPEDSDSKENSEVEEVKNIDILSGSWQGEEGLERVELMRGGRGIALLSSGITILLQIRIHEGYLTINQSGKPMPRQFINLPDEIAKKAAEMGKTPSWKFLVSADNKILVGEKTDIEIIYHGNTLVSVNEVIKKVRWIKN
ncbi:MULTISPECIES: TP0183 family DNA metabolism protein [Treponema]|jgi:hypothetical protein|uniref:Uncharacterized protein n=1 Tax=Treponema denticola OTK TaxID=999434 RepID=A0A0F6MLS1_TREDN|nr:MULTISPECIES: hypothetical protein [Treponema]EMB19340.1 hypothetical protein HMPREF9723_02554 [Treponema denticola OTK]EMB43256.1 hypothetical protein HMPREF9729_02244 [Treponema denticola ASLM]EMB46928.1 hypothetical protein HMPREF9730_00326 [Treponema denticola AL-2]EMD56619.1 hypothetical protein HMPREF9728_01433 [Treponema denticola US-Trep]UTC85236.1 hypothetical protein E4N91_06180 [Treponema denticola]